ncbi:MAG TPA: hypothetical protein ENN55_01035 [Firmicutes bacterium]|nr:hypothetical protein [Bacillota bacterium]
MKLKKFILNAEDAYACADAGVLRAGAATLSEIAAAGLPSLLVPYPYATGNHQEENAKVFAKKNAAVVVRDREFAPQVFVSSLKRLLNKKTAESIRKNIEKIYKGNGSENIADILIERVKNG